MRCHKPENLAIRFNPEKIRKFEIISLLSKSFDRKVEKISAVFRQD